MPSVVNSSKGPTLGDQLDLRNLPLSTTPGGRAFAIKALHPSDHEFKNPRGPGTLLPSLSIASDQIETFNFPANCEKAVIIQTPNPWFPAQLLFFNQSDVITERFSILNTALGGVTQKTTWFDQTTNGSQIISENFQSHRVLSQSITVEVIAPALADQGTIVSAQFEANPRKMTSCVINTTLNSSDQEYQNLKMNPEAWIYDPAPNVSTLLTATSAYTSKAKEGVYQPLKISKFKWKSSNSGFIPFTNTNDPVPGYYPSTKLLTTFPYELTVKKLNDVNSLPLPTSDVIGVTFIEGVSTTNMVSLRIRTRQVVEFIPYPGTKYAALCEAPLPPDDLAYRMVREIAGRMQDAYPSSYNDWDKLKNVISTIGKAVLPVVEPVMTIASRALPGGGIWGPMVGKALKTLGSEAAKTARKVKFSKKDVDDMVKANKQIDANKQAVDKYLLAQAMAAAKQQSPVRRGRSRRRRSRTRSAPAPKRGTLVNLLD